MNCSIEFLQKSYRPKRLSLSIPLFVLSITAKIGNIAQSVSRLHSKYNKRSVKMSNYGVAVILEHLENEEQS